jgi:hypothetical protein
MPSWNSEGDCRWSLGSQRFGRAVSRASLSLRRTRADFAPSQNRHHRDWTAFRQASAHLYHTGSSAKREACLPFDWGSVEVGGEGMDIRFTPLGAGSPELFVHVVLCPAVIHHTRLESVHLSWARRARRDNTWRGEARIGQTRRARISQLSALNSRQPDTKYVVLYHSVMFIRQGQLPLAATLDIALPSPSSVDVQVVNLSKAAKVGDEKLLEVCHIFGSGGLTNAGDVKDGRRLRGRSRSRRVDGEGARSATRPRGSRKQGRESSKKHLCIESCGQPMSTVRRPILETRGPTKKRRDQHPPLGR